MRHTMQPMIVKIGAHPDGMGRFPFTAEARFGDGAHGHIIGFDIDSHGEAIVQEALARALDGTEHSLLNSPQLAVGARRIVGLRRNAEVGPGLFVHANGTLGPGVPRCSLTAIVRVD